MLLLNFQMHSKWTRAELLDVLNRPFLRTRYKAITDNTVGQIIQIYDAATRVEVEEIPAVSRDKKDDIFLATALAGDADFIVTEDQDLLVLTPYEGIRIVNALDFLRILEGSSESQA